MISIPEFLQVIDSFASLTGNSPATISRRVLGGGARIRNLRTGGDIGIKTVERALQWFSDHWPDTAAWPAGVARPPVAGPSGDVPSAAAPGSAFAAAEGPTAAGGK